MKTPPAAAGLALLIALSATGIADAGLVREPIAAQAKPCKAETKRLKQFQRGMASRRRAFFRSHRSAKARRTFVKQQRKKLKTRRRARARCLRANEPPPLTPVPPPPPAPVPPSPAPPTRAAVSPDITPPVLVLESPTAGTWFDVPRATLRGRASDAGSGLASVKCAGQAATLAGGRFTCEVPLAAGANQIAVTAADAAGNTARTSVTVRHGPGLLAGAEDGAALAQVRDTDTDPRHEDSELETTLAGQRVARGEIGVRIAPTATVAQVNAALASVGGTIAGAVAGAPQLAVTIPDPGSLSALEDVLDELRAMPGIERSTLADMPATNELPPGFASPPSVAGGAALSHLIALRMPAAWNARRAIRLADRPTLIVADMFGDGPLSALVDVTYNSAALRRLTGRNEHGYHVVGIAASSFSTNGTVAGNVTGVFPATTPLHVIEAIGASTQMTGVRIIQQANARTGHVVVNTSLGWDVTPTDDQAQQGGSDWAQLVRGTAGLEDRLLHATSAGNVAGPSSTNSRWSASLRSDLTDAAGQPMGALRNTLSVENLVETSAPALEPGCLAVSSNRGGTIAAVGTDVHSHLFGSAAGDKTGTSMASPQVAGLAMYLWSLAPDLSAPQLRAAMVATARPALPDDATGCNTDVPSAPRLDAYAAVLSLDRPVALTPATAPVRTAILDQDADRDFDEDDLELFSDAARADAGDRDYSRSDLNGDGFTGGAATLPLDLSLVGSTRGGAPRLEKVNQGIEGVSVEFDEAAVTDMQALCFYAYSKLYTGSPDRRATLLEPRERCDAEQQFTNGKLVAVGRSPRGLGQLFPPPRLWTIEPPAAPVTFTPEGESPGQPAWSPDGERIAYPRFAPAGQEGIWIIDAAGGGAARIAGTQSGDDDPTWSPDGTRIAFNGRGRTPAGIGIVDADGGAPALVPGTSGYRDPSWSPDGRLIAASTGGQQPDIVVFAPDGLGKVELTDNGTIEEYSPDWSPDGTRIVFVSNRQIPGGTVTRTRLWIMDADGSDVTLFTAPFGTNTSGTTVQDEHPVWAPDGTSIAFARSHQNGSRFVMTKEDDPEELAVAVTPLPTDDTDHTFDLPDWQPRPVEP